MINYYFRHPLIKPIEFSSADNFIQITGQNKKVQLYLKQIIEWSVLGHRYTELQIESLLNQELLWMINDKVIGKNDYRFLRINNREDLIYHLSGKKGSLGATYFNLINNNVDVVHYIDKINDLLELISIEYKKQNEKYDLNYEIDIKRINLNDITQQYFTFSFMDNGVYCIDFIESEYLMRAFIKILSILINDTEINYLLYLEDLSKLVPIEKVELLLNDLHQLSRKGQLTIISFGSTSSDLLIKKDLLETILICGDSECQPFYDWISIHNYLQCNYPCSFDIEDEKLLSYFKRIIPYLLSQDGQSYIPYDQSLVLFVLLNEGFYFHNYQQRYTPKLSRIEWNFLEEKLYKL